MRWAAGFDPDPTPRRTPPIDAARERSLQTARTLLAIIDASVPDARPAARGTDVAPPRDTVADVEARMARALGCLSTADAAALVQALERLHGLLRAHRWPRTTGRRGGAGLWFRPMP